MPNCPRCSEPMPEKKGERALSRRDNKTHVCPRCGLAEALFDTRLSSSDYPAEVKEGMRKLERSWLDKMDET